MFLSPRGECYCVNNLFFYIEKSSVYFATRVAAAKGLVERK